MSVYLDYHSTTPVDRRVLKKMLPFFSRNFGSESSKNHQFGWEAEAAVEQARRSVSQLIGAEDSEIYFTSGATESNNIAILGSWLRGGSKPGRFVSIDIEHDSVIGPLHFLKSQGCAISIVPVDKHGLLEIESLEAALCPETTLVSVALANHEIGTIQYIDRISRACKQAGALLHIDATQAVGKIPVDVNAIGCDYLSLSGHKIYAPKGIGALYVSTSAIVPAPLCFGGNQERSLRPGSVPVPLVVGLGEAASLCMVDENLTESQRLAELRDLLWKGIANKCPGVMLHGPALSDGKRLPGNLNIGFSGLDGDEFHRLIAANGLAVSRGSACATATMEPSRVLLAIGVKPMVALATLRFGLGRFTTKDEVLEAVDVVSEAFSRWH